eukprot:1194706-Prorocentrum_minimum.AAC.2
MNHKWLLISNLLHGRAKEVDRFDCYDVPDAAAYLLERIGNVAEALDICLAQVEHSVDTLRLELKQVWPVSQSVSQPVSQPASQSASRRQ